MKSTSEALTRLTALCAQSEHCISDIRSRLDTWEIDDEDERQKIIDYLTQNNFIDEYRYCRAYVNDRLRYARHGRIKMAAALRQKHLPADAISQALEQLDDELYVQTLNDLIQSKRRTTHAPDEYQLRAKLIRFAQSRGFELDLILDQLQE